MTNTAYEATNSDVEKLINSEIADFFAGFGHPGESETPQEMQQQLQSRISAIFNAAPNGMMQLSNELAEMKRKCVELEARSITVKWPDYVDGRTLGYGEVNHMIDLCVDAVELACHASGIRIKSED